MEAAIRVFAKKGYRGTTTAMLAKAAGVTEPILYRHFKNKLELFITLIDEASKEVIEMWHEALLGEHDGHKRLRMLLASNPAKHERGESVYRMIFQAMTEIEGDEEISRSIKRHVTKLHAFIRRELESLQKSGAVREDEPAEDLAWLLVNVGIGYGLTSPIGLGGVKSSGERPSIERLIEELLLVDEKRGGKK
jgi:AcrR family transcriptional regulator